MGKNFIELKTNNWENDYNILYNLMNYEDGIKEIFGNRLDRLQNARLSRLIKMNEKYIGFVNLVCEKMNHDYFFLDMGIITDYRGKGIGKHSLEAIKKFVEEKQIREFVLMEIKKGNIGAIRIAEDIGCYLTEFGDRNVYLLQKERYQEFIDGNHMEKLAYHYCQGNDKKSLVKDYYG